MPLQLRPVRLVEFAGRQRELPHPPGRILVRGHLPPIGVKQPLFRLAELADHFRIDLPQAVAARVRVPGLPQRGGTGHKRRHVARRPPLDAEVRLRIAIRSFQESLAVLQRASADRLADQQVAAADDERARPQVRDVAAPGAHRADAELLQAQHAAGLLQGHAVDQHLRRVAIQRQVANRPERLFPLREIAAEAGDVLPGTADARVAVVVQRPSVRAAVVAQERVPVPQAVQARRRDSLPAGRRNVLRRTERGTMTGETADDRILSQRERGLHRRVPVDRILDVDPAAPAREGQRLGQRGKRLRRRAKPAVAALRIQSGVAVDDGRAARIDILPPRRRRGVGPDVGVTRRSRPAGHVQRDLRRQVRAAADGRAGVAGTEVFLLEVGEQVLVAARVVVFAGQPLQDVQHLRVPVEPLGPGLVRQRRDHVPLQPQPQAEGVIAGQRFEIDALRIGQSAEQLVLPRVAEVDVVVDLGSVADAQFDICVAQQRRGEVVDQQVVDHAAVRHASRIRPPPLS